MTGYMKKILRVNLSKKQVKEEELPKKWRKKFLGGRGFALKYLWENLETGTDPLSPQNKLIFATGPITGTPTINSGKMVIASKSPLTGGYGDGNIGTSFAVRLKMCGYDMIVLEGKAENPVYIHITPKKVQIKDASELWGKGIIETEEKLKKELGKETGILSIGPGGENLVKYATVLSEFGRSGGRPGMGTVMGSKKVKALVANSNNGEEIPVANLERLRELAWEARTTIKQRDFYKDWIDKGTMNAVRWTQENSVFPSYNFQEGVYEHTDALDGETMLNEFKYLRKGCPFCQIPCGLVAKTQKEEFGDITAELDYENVALLGSNIGMKSLDEVIVLNYLCDDLGVDTISVGNTIGFAFELFEKGIIDEEDTGGLELKFGNYEVAKKLLKLLAKKKGFGKILAQGTKRMAKEIGQGVEKFAMNVKGLEISGYDSHSAPGMAVTYGVSPIGAHHKDAWFIAWEREEDWTGRRKEEMEALQKMQRIRGGFFEAAVMCRLPWIELDLSFEEHIKMLNAVTGKNYDKEELFEISDRTYALMRAFWAREFGSWKREYDNPPDRWFEEPLEDGPRKGETVDRDLFERLLDYYYELYEWDENGLPKKSTLKKLDLDGVIKQLEDRGIELTE